MRRSLESCLTHYRHDKSYAEVVKKSKQAQMEEKISALLSMGLIMEKDAVDMDYILYNGTKEEFDLLMVAFEIVVF